MRRVGSLAALGFPIRVSEIEHDALDPGAEQIDHFTLAVGLHPVQSRIGHLQVPGIVRQALLDSLGGDDRVAGFGPKIRASTVM